MSLPRTITATFGLSTGNNNHSAVRIPWLLSHFISIFTVIVTWAKQPCTYYENVGTVTMFIRSNIKPRSRRLRS